MDSANNKNNYKVSIITACYNSEQYIEQTIKSVINQTYTNWEWIITDDASTDSSISIIENYINIDPRIKIIKLENNKGVACARNLSLELATGRFITFIDSDDLWKKDFLNTTIDYLLKNNEQLVYTSYERKDENLNPKLKDFNATEDIDFKRLLYNCPIPMLTSIYDAKNIGKIKIPNIDKREDYAMWFDILKKIPKAKAINITLGTYRIRNNSYSRNKLLMTKKQFEVYFYFLKLPLIKSIFYTLSWIINGLKKYA